ncbi:MAG: chaplin family protein [Actinophytocola sp.]|uniref:chaplin family protein n=1 Tax=Actinophytocola sp. TaxID=1872138 RepID=UPI003C744408
MLGTGIASADEDVNPDKPASPLDGSVTIPVHTDNNVLGTPFGQQAIPGVHRDIKVSASQITGALPIAPAAPVTDPLVAKAMGTAAPVVAKAQGAVAPLPKEGLNLAAPLADKATPVTDKLKSLPVGDKVPALSSLDAANVPAIDEMCETPLQGNQLNLDLVVPVDISGNAIALLGHAETTNDSDHSYGWNHDAEADGSHSFLGGNVVDLDWALPVQITNNAVAGLGNASAEGTNSQEAWSTGDIDTDGSHSFLGGNVLAPQFATPVQVDGNAVAGGGCADATSEAQTSAEAGGSILTGGEDSIGGGNAVPVPVAVPARLNGNAIMGLGKSVAFSESTADATAGATRTGMFNVPTYVETNGDPALAAGNIVQPAVSGPAMLCGNAAGAAGLADAVCDSSTTTSAGGTSRSTGAGSVASGAIAAVPVALPVQGYGNALTGLGDVTADATNNVDSTAGGDAYTRGHDSIASGTTANAPVSGTGDVFSNAVAGVGEASATGQNVASVVAGGHTGTTGDDSAAGGNVITSPVNSPTEVYGNAAAGLGGAVADATETKSTSSGGGGSAVDDNGVGASNLVTTPVATAAQVFGNGAGAVGVTDASATADNEVIAGGDNKATGKAGLGSGNIGQVPVSLPAQVFGTGVSGLAKGTQTAVNQTYTEAGGDATSDGTYGAAAGNVVTAPVAGAGQVYGESVSALGLNESLADSQTATSAGGGTETSGECGLISGNVASPQALPVAQSFAAVASAVGGAGSSSSTNETFAESGGDIDTTGDAGFLSGNLVDVPAAAPVQPFGDAVAAVASHAYAEGVSETQGEVGGKSTTSGEMGSLSGLDATLPAAVNAPVYDVPVEILAEAVAESTHTGDLRVGEGEPQVNLPISGGMSPTELPSVHTQRSMPAPADDFRGAFTGVLPGFAGGMTGLPGHGQFTDMAANGGLSQEPRILPAPASRADVNPLGGGLGGDPLSGLLSGLPVNSLFGNLPTSGLPVGVPAQRDLTPELPLAGQTLAPGLGDIPLVQAPSIGTLPVPGVSEVAAPELGGSSLESTRAALANLFNIPTIA